MNKKEEICKNCGCELWIKSYDINTAGEEYYCPNSKCKKFRPIHSPQGNTTKEGSIPGPEDTSKEF